MPSEHGPSEHGLLLCLVHTELRISVVRKFAVGFWIVCAPVIARVIALFASVDLDELTCGGKNAEA